MNGTATTYGRLSWVFAAISGLTFLLAMAGLPRNDGIHGTYLNLLLEFADSRPAQPLELRAMSPFAITEGRIISALFVVAMFSSVASVIAALWARRRREEPRIYAGSVAICVVLLAILIQYRWAIEW